LQPDKLSGMIVPLIDRDENGLPVGQADSLRRVANPPQRHFRECPAGSVAATKRV
jgi:hypothetical protein